MRSSCPNPKRVHVEADANEPRSASKPTRAAAIFVQAPIAGKKEEYIGCRISRYTPVVMSRCSLRDLKRNRPIPTEIQVAAIKQREGAAQEGQS